MESKDLVHLDPNSIPPSPDNTDIGRGGDIRLHAGGVGKTR
jgi:hypothetical protein